MNVTPSRFKPGLQLKRPDVREREDVSERHQAKINSYGMLYVGSWTPVQRLCIKHRQVTDDYIGGMDC